MFDWLRDLFSGKCRHWRKCSEYMEDSSACMGNEDWGYCGKRRLWQTTWLI